MKKILAALGFGLIATLGTSHTASAQAEPYIGQVMTTAASYCPRGWAEMQGQLLPISSNQALFALIGTTYGGDGRSTFALPDTRGRAVVGNGQGPGLPFAQPGARAFSGAAGSGGAPVLVMRHCIALVGLFPPRN